MYNSVNFDSILKIEDSKTHNVLKAISSHFQRLLRFESQKGYEGVKCKLHFHLLRDPLYLSIGCNIAEGRNIIFLNNIYQIGIAETEN